MISSPGCELVDVTERLAERRAVAGDRGVAELAGQRRLGIVTRALLEVVERHARHDVQRVAARPCRSWGSRAWPAPGRARSAGCSARRVPAPWSGTSTPAATTCRSGSARSCSPAADVGSRRRHGGGRCRRRRDGRGRRGRRLRLGDELLELVLQLVLRPRGLDAGAPQLIGDEPEHQQPGRDQDLAEPAHVEAPVVRLGRAVPLAHPLRFGRLLLGRRDRLGRGVLAVNVARQLLGHTGERYWRRMRQRLGRPALP